MNNSTSDNVADGIMTWDGASGAIETNKANFTDTTDSTSMATGAVKISGGLGVSGQTSTKSIMIDDNVILSYDSTAKCLDFTFA